MCFRNLAGGTRLPVVYLLHGGGGDFRDWTNNSDVAGFAERGLVLVMPQGDAAYFTNSVSRPQDRYEDYVVKDLIQDVESKFPVLQNREGRAIVGISLGGLAALRFAFKHPELYQFAAGISPAIDVPRRGFSVRRPGQWLSYRSAFGPLGSDARNHDDPFLLAKTAEPVELPYLFLTCGDKEGLLSPNREFDAVLTRRHIAHEFHVGPGGHDWNQWNGWLGPCFESLQKYIGHAQLEQH